MSIGGTADLPLHRGHVPPWLMGRMKNLADAVIKVMVEELGRREILRRMGDPYWFQAFGCLLGFDWHSSGLTTVVTGALRESITLNSHGIGVAGGKGALGTKTPQMIYELDLPEELKIKLIKVSRISAKVDNAVLQDGYNIYHHTMMFTEDGDWAVIQQGMNQLSKYARRYHWISENIVSFVEEPHSGIAGDKKEEAVLNLTSSKSRDVRKTSVDLISENPSKLVRLINLSLNRQETLTRWMDIDFEVQTPPHLNMPRKINWKAVKKAYDIKPGKYEELIQIEGVGASTLRALALISTLVYGVQIDWRDPLKFTFAHGGKDGVPYPVSRKKMDESISFLKSILDSTNIDREEKLKAFRRLVDLERRLYL